MNAKKIDQYFTPSTSPALKRLRSSSSPTLSGMATDMDQKVGDLTQGQLVSLLSSLLEDKLSKLATKEDLSHLSRKIDTLEEDNKRLRHEITLLKSKERLVMDRVVDLESRSRRNNLIFKGLKVPERTTDYCHIVRKFCTEVMGSRDTIWVNRAHPLGRDQSTLIAHLPDDGDIHYIMSRVKTLKNTGYVVHRDFPLEVRQKRANLAKVRAEVERVAGRRKMPLVHDHLTIEGCRFTWWDGKLWAGRTDGGVRLKELIGRDFAVFLKKLQQGDVDRGGDRATEESRVEVSVTSPEGGELGDTGR